MRKEISLAEYGMPEIKRGTTPAEIVAGIRERLTRFCEAVHHDQPPERNDANLAALVLDAMLGSPSAVDALRALQLIDAKGRVVLKASGRKRGRLLDSPDAWLGIAYDTAALLARGTVESKLKAYDQIAKRHRGLTAARVRELYRGHYPIFQSDLEALPKRVTKAQVKRDNPDLTDDHALLRAYGRRVIEADQQRAIIVSRLEKLAALHWSCCKKG